MEDGEDYAEDRDEYLAENIFFVSKEARWEYVASNDTSPEIGQLIDQAMISIEEEDPKFNGILPKNYARPELDKRRLGEVVVLFDNLKLKDHGSSKDILGRTYEYAIAKFASLEGRNAGEFYTPTSIVRTIVKILEPYQGRGYDTCCGSRAVIVTQANSYVNTRSSRLLPKFKIKKMNSWCAV